jgi:hypothetical protein
MWAKFLWHILRLSPVIRLENRVIPWNNPVRIAGSRLQGDPSAIGTYTRRNKLSQPEQWESQE